MKPAIYTPLVGDSIAIAAADLIDLATTRKVPAVMLFNGVVVAAYGHETPEEVQAAWAVAMDAKAARWRASPDGIAFAEKQERERQEAIAAAGQRKAWPLHAVLTAITGRVWGDFGDVRDLADWVDAGISNMRTKVLANMPTIPEGIDTIPPEAWPTSADDLPAKMAAQVERFGASVIVCKALPAWVNS